MEKLIWIMVFVIALLIVDAIMLRQRVYKLQEQLNVQNVVKISQ